MCVDDELAGGESSPFSAQKFLLVLETRLVPHLHTALPDTATQCHWPLAARRACLHTCELLEGRVPGVFCTSQEPSTGSAGREASG